MAGPSASSASTVAAAASSRWMNDMMPPPSPIIGNWRLRTAVDHRVVLVAVEAAVAQRDAARRGDRLVDVRHRREHQPRRGRGIGQQGVVLVLDRAAGVRVAERREALRDEPSARPPRAAAASRLSVPLVRSRLVGAKRAVHVAGEGDAAQGGGLVDDRVGTGRGDHGAHRAGVEHVEHGRLGAERPELPGLGGRPGGAGDLMAALGQLGNEAAADRAAARRPQELA